MKKDVKNALAVDTQPVKIKKSRFFFHYRKSTGGMTVHYKGQCIPCQDVDCRVPIETHRNKQQPRLVLRGFYNEINIIENTILIK